MEKKVNEKLHTEKMPRAFEKGILFENLQKY